MSVLSSLYEKQLRAAEPGKPVLTIVDGRLNALKMDYAALDADSSQAAAFLCAQGCLPGERVLISAASVRTVFAFFWGALKTGAVPCVLYPGLGFGGVNIRLKAADANFWVSDSSPEKITGNLTFPNSLKKVILTVAEAKEAPFVTYQPQPAASESFPWVDREEDAPAFMVFTSGTTGTPKPVVHRVGIVPAIERSMRNVLHASERDVYWCTAHPAWITGTVYGLLGPLLCGISSIQYEGIFHMKRWLPILSDRQVSLWYTAPTALRAMMREAPEGFGEAICFPALKQIYSIGEPLPAAVSAWGQRAFHQPVYDTWFSTEAGTIRIAGQPGETIIPGVIGHPVDDTSLRVLDSKGAECAEGAVGELFLCPPWESLFSEYYQMPAETDNKYQSGLFKTGDLVRVRENGGIAFEGRADDVINTSGHLVSPAEVEQVLMAHAAVAEAAVVAEPDPLLYEHVAAFLVLAPGQEWSQKLMMELRVAVTREISGYAVPKNFYAVESLPYTLNGKLNRAELRKTNSCKNGL